jgi:hypothetical protein
MATLAGGGARRARGAANRGAAASGAGGGGAGGGMNRSDSAALRADPLADATIARILCRCDAPAPGHAPVEALAIVNRQLAQWKTNGDLAAWRADSGVPAPVAAALEDYVQAALRLPDWADPAQLARAQTVFTDMSMLSCTLLFCASLPECYVMPELAGVLHTAGQLVQHTDYRIRSTAAMIFPVMLKGGLTSPDGGGVAQVLKVRLIHATIRHLILHGEPGEALRDGAPSVIPAQPALGGGLHQALYDQGWDTGRDGLPCNQEQLSFTLMTFHYAFLRGLRSLGLGLPEEDEEAYLHAWNVVGHLLGIERALMPDTMAAAEALFARMKARGIEAKPLPDSRPALGKALMQTMENAIPLRLFKPFPVLLTRYLCGRKTAGVLGINGPVSWLSQLLFAGLMLLVRGIDTVARRFSPGFSVSRLVTRAVGYRMTARILMDQTRPLKIPGALLIQVNAAMRGWETDAKAPRWMNQLEARLAGRNPPPPPAPEGAK